MTLSKLTKYLLLLAGLCGFVFTGYFIDRVSETYFVNQWELPVFLSVMTVLFGGYFYLIHKKGGGFTLREIIVGAVVFRIALAGMMPNLSDDYFRFVWDGRLLANGENPYMVLPDSFVVNEPELATNLSLTGEVYEGLNSKTYYTIYPPLNQLCFTISALAGGERLFGNVLVLRIIVYLGEALALLMLLLLLRHFKQPDWHLLIYAFNPLVVIELSGNLHFEGWMISLFLLGVWLLIKSKCWQAGVAIAAAVGMKLIPLIFLPLLIKRIGWKNLFIVGGIVAVLTAGSFALFINAELIQNFGSSLDLYFRSFEFNASVYYLLRPIGEALAGYNLIAYIGPGLALIVFVSIFRMGLRPKNTDWPSFFRQALFAMTIYLALTTTVHPWYIVSLVALSVFSHFRYALVWSATALLSYFKYISSDYPEPYAWIVVEYLVVGAVLIYELRRERKLAANAIR